MMLLTGYKSKKELKESVGKTLSYQETSMFGAEYQSSGSFCAAHRPAVTGLPGKEFFASIVMKDDKIASVS